jgi:hypothetical protein
LQDQKRENKRQQNHVHFRANQPEHKDHQRQHGKAPESNIFNEALP